MNYAGFTDSLEIVIVTLIFSDVVPQLNLLSSELSSERPLCCLTSLANHIVQFSRCSSSSQSPLRSGPAFRRDLRCAPLLLLFVKNLFLTSETGGRRFGFQPLLQSDLKIQPWLGLQIQQQTCLVGPSGLEPPTLRLSVARSSQLSYGPLFALVEIVGIEPATSCLQGRRSPS